MTKYRYYFPAPLLLSSKIKIFIAGMISGLVFAPIFFLPGLLGISYLCYKNKLALNYMDSFWLGSIFGFGHFLTSMYWISFALGVYIEDFWWAIPFALFGIPLILAIFIGLTTSFSWAFRNSSRYQFLFCIIWIFFEWTRSWIMTGLPWNLIGYALSFSTCLVQSANIFGIYGLSFIVIYLSSNLYYFFTQEQKLFRLSLLTNIFIICLLIIYGVARLYSNPTVLSNLKVRLVQPSIPQQSKWDIEELYSSLDKLTNLSLQSFNNPNLIIWSEAALTLPYSHPAIKSRLLNMLNKTNSILLTGGVSDNGEENIDKLKLYTSFQAIDSYGDQLFEYYKSHLVPFGEYIPFKEYLLIKKLTHGIMDYTPGDIKLVELKSLQLKIKPLICYESIFPEIARVLNSKVDIIINITNDTWYGNSSGPYQHLYISIMRGIENGLPFIRVANNGITVIVDPLGRIVNKLGLNEVAYLDGFIPFKINNLTIYSILGNNSAIIAIMLTFIIQLLIKFITKKLLY